MLDWNKKLIKHKKKPSYASRSSVQWESRCKFIRTKVKSWQEGEKVALFWFCLPFICTWLGDKVVHTKAARKG